MSALLEVCRSMSNNRVLISTELHFEEYDGEIYTGTSGGYSFWQRYLQVFDEVIVVARVKKQLSSPLNGVRVNGKGVYVHPMPDYTGPWRYLQCRKELQQVVQIACEGLSAVILRVPGPVGDLVWRQMTRQRRPFALEVVGDPYDVFAPGANSHLFRPFFRWWFTHRLRRQCLSACAVAYVTEHYLQKRYPNAPGVFATHFSSIELSEEAFVACPRPVRYKMRYTVIFVGALAQLYKGLDVLLRAINVCIQSGLEIDAVIIGDGKYRSDVENLVLQLGINAQVHFLGYLPAGEAVRMQLDQADVLVLPSRTEGLPRVLIEAMARGLPCIASTAGGIPELLPPEDMVFPGDVSALALKIQEVLTDPERMARMSARNLQRAREYHDDILSRRRSIFYQRVRELTWADSQSKEQV